MKFSEHIRKYDLQPSIYVKKILDEKKIGYLKNVNLFNENADYLASQEYGRVHDQYVRNGKPNDFMGLFYGIGKHEEKIQDKLKQIAEEAIREIFGVPDYIKFDSEIIEPSKNFNSELEENVQCVEITEELEQEIHKRILLNALTHGAAIHSWKTAHHLIKDKVDEINPELIPLYSKFTSLVSMYLFQIESELPLIANGISCVNNEEEDEEISIVAKANSLPVLLHEMVKGVLSLWMQHGIPNNLSEEEIMTVYSVADEYQDEYYHYLLGPSLWENFLTTTDLYPYELAPVVTRLAQLSPKQVEDVLTACVNDKNYAKSLMKTYKLL